MSTRTLCCATLVMLFVTAPARAQSLVDVARQDAGRRSAVAHPARIYSNADLRPVFDTPPPPAASAPAARLPEQPRAESPQTPAMPAAPVHKDHGESTVARQAHAERHAHAVERHAQTPVVVIYQFVPWIVHPMGVTTGTNTPREQAMADYMRAAGFAPPLPATGAR